MSKHGSNIRDFFGPSSQHPIPKPTPSSQSTRAPKPVISQPSPKLTPGTLEVENSDDDDGGDSDSSLESLTDILRARRGGTARAPIARIPSPPRNRKPIISNSPVKKKYRFDLKSLVSEAARDDATEVSAKRVQALYENVGQDGSGDSRDDHEVDATAMVVDAAMEDGDDGGAQKVMQALRRTEATHIQQTWYFFDTKPPSKATQKRFPAKSIKKNSWHHDLLDVQSRQHTLESGIAKDLVSLGETLPDELVLWILDEIPSITRDPLRSAYCNLIDVLPDDQLERILQPELVRKLFRELGGTDEATNIHQRIVTRTPVPDPYPDRGWDALISTFHLLSRLGQRIQSSTRNDMVCLVARLCLDIVVIANLDLLAACQAAISSLVKSLPDSNWEHDLCRICHTIYHFTELNPLRVQILRCIPAHSPRLQEFRRRLALSFFLQDLTITQQPSDTSFSLSRVTAQLERPQFAITDSTDYLNLSALMTLLDIAVDAAQSKNLDLQDEKIEKTFNEDVDILSMRIKVIWSSINDTGASFISRIEAKEVMEGVRYRLMFAVRTQEKPKESVFDRKAGDEDFSSEQKGMKGFLNTVKRNKEKENTPVMQIKAG